MKSLTERLNDLFGPRRTEHDWCDTTRLANPWSVLLGGARQPDNSGDDAPGDPAERSENRRAGGTLPVTDLRDISGPGVDQGGAA